MADDAYLLRQYADARSEAAFAQLVERHLSLVYHSALRQLEGDAHLAQDVTQTVFVLLAAKAFTLHSHPSLAGWLYATTHFKVSEAQRAERRRKHREEIASVLRETMTDHPARAEQAQLGALIDHAILELSEQDREAVLLRFFEGQAYADIGARLMLTEKTAHKRVERALDKLRECLARYGITSTAAALAASLGTQAGMAAPSGLAARVTGVVMASAAPTASLPTTITFLIKANAGVGSFVGIAAILGLVSIGTGIYEFRESSRIEAALKAATNQYETDQEQMRVLERKAQTADKTLVDLQRKVDLLHTAQAARTVGGTAVRAGGSKIGSQVDWQQFQSAFPAVRDMLTNGIKAQLQRGYGLFFQRAGLTPAQILEFENRTGEVMLQSEAIGPGFIVSTVNQLPDDQLRTLLGDEAFQEFQDYNRRIPAIFVANSVLSSTAGAGAPISADQEEKIAGIIADNSPTYKSGQPIDPSSVDWANAQAQAQMLLSPAQWQTAEGIFLKLQYQQALAQAQRN